MNPSHDYITLFVIPTLIRGIQHHNGSIPVNVDAHKGTPLADSLLRLRHDSLNEFDANAVEVLDNVDGLPSASIQPLGFLPRGLAKSLALIVKESGDISADNPITRSNDEVAATALPTSNDNIPLITVSAHLGWGTVKKWRTRTRHALSRALSLSSTNAAHISPRNLLVDPNLAYCNSILAVHTSDALLDATSDATAAQPSPVTRVPLRDAARLVDDWRRYGVEAPTSLPRRANPLRWAWEEWASARDASAKAGVPPTTSAASLPSSSSAVSIPSHTAPVTVTVAVHRTVVAALVRLLHRQVYPAAMPAAMPALLDAMPDANAAPAAMSVECTDVLDVCGQEASAPIASATATPPASTRSPSRRPSHSLLASLLLRLLCVLCPGIVSSAGLPCSSSVSSVSAPAEAAVALTGAGGAEYSATTPPSAVSPRLASASVAHAAPPSPRAPSHTPLEPSPPHPPLAARTLFPCAMSNGVAARPSPPMNTTSLPAQRMSSPRTTPPLSTHSHAALPSPTSPLLAPALTSPRAHTLALLRTLIRALLALAAVPGLCEADASAPTAPSFNLLPPSTAALAALTPLLSTLALPLPAPPPSLPAVLALLRELDGPAPTATQLRPQRLLSLLSAVSAYNIPPAALTALPTLARTRQHATATPTPAPAPSAPPSDEGAAHTGVCTRTNITAPPSGEARCEAELSAATCTMASMSATTVAATAVSADAASSTPRRSPSTHSHAAPPPPWMLPLPPSTHALTHLSALYLVLLRALAPGADRSPPAARVCVHAEPSSASLALLSLTDVFVLSAFARLPLHLQRSLAKLLCSGDPQPAARVFVPALAQALRAGTHTTDGGDDGSVCDTSPIQTLDAEASTREGGDGAVRSANACSADDADADAEAEADVAAAHSMEALFSGLDLGAFAWVRVASLARHAHRSKPAHAAADGWAACVQRLKRLELRSSAHAGAVGEGAGAGAAPQEPHMCSPRAVEAMSAQAPVASASAAGTRPIAAAVGQNALRRVHAAATALSSLPAAALWPAFAAREEQRDLPAALAELGALTAAHPLFAPLRNALPAASRLSGPASAWDAPTPPCQSGLALSPTQPLFLETASSLPPRHFICLSVAACPKTLLQSLCKDLSVAPCAPAALLQRLARTRGLDGVPLLDSKFTVRIVLKRCGDLARVSRALEDAVVRMCAAARLAHSRAAQVSGRPKGGQAAGLRSSPVAADAAASASGGEAGAREGPTLAATAVAAPTAVGTLDSTGVGAVALSAAEAELVEEDEVIDAGDKEMEDDDADDAADEGEDEDEERGHDAEAEEGGDRVDEEVIATPTSSDSVADRSERGGAEASGDEEAEEAEEAGTEGFFSVRAAWERHYGRHAREHTRMISYSRRRRAATTQMLIASCDCGNCDGDALCAWPRDWTLHALAALASGATLRRMAQEAAVCGAGDPLRHATAAASAGAADGCELMGEPRLSSARPLANATDADAHPDLMVEALPYGGPAAVANTSRTVRTPLPHLHSLVLAALQRSEALFADLLRLSNPSARGGSGKRPRASPAASLGEDEESGVSAAGGFTGGHDAQRQSAREKARAVEQESSALRDLCIRLCGGADAGNARAVGGVALLPPASGVAIVCRCDAGHFLYKDVSSGGTFSACGNTRGALVGDSTGHDVLLGICPWCAYLLFPSTAPPTSSSSSSTSSSSASSASTAATTADADGTTLMSTLAALAAQYQQRVNVTQHGRAQVASVTVDAPIARARHEDLPGLPPHSALTVPTAATAVARVAPVWAGLCEADTALRWVFRALHASAAPRAASAEARDGPCAWSYSWPHGLSFTRRPPAVTPVSAAKTLMLTVLAAANADLPRGPTRGSSASTATAALLPANAALALPWLPWRAFWRLARLVVSALHRARAHAHAFVLMCHLLCLSLALQYRLYRAPTHADTVLSPHPRVALDADSPATATATDRAGVADARLAWWSMLVLANTHTDVRVPSATHTPAPVYQRITWAPDTAARMCGARARNEWWELIPVLLKHVAAQWTSARKDFLSGTAPLDGAASTTATTIKNIDVGGRSGRKKDARISGGNVPAARQRGAAQVSDRESNALKQEDADPAAVYSAPRRQGNSWLRRLGGDDVLGVLAGGSHEPAMSDDRVIALAGDEDAIDLALEDTTAAEDQCEVDDTASALSATASATARPMAVSVIICVRDVCLPPLSQQRALSPQTTHSASPPRGSTALIRRDGCNGHTRAVLPGALPRVTCTCTCGHQHRTPPATRHIARLSCSACSRCPLAALLALGPAAPVHLHTATRGGGAVDAPHETDGDVATATAHASGPWWVVAAGSAHDTTAHAMHPCIPTAAPPAPPAIAASALTVAAVPAPALAALLALALPLASLADPMLMFGPRRAALHRALAAEAQHAALVGTAASAAARAVSASDRVAGVDADAPAGGLYSPASCVPASALAFDDVVDCCAALQPSALPSIPPSSSLSPLAPLAADTATIARAVSELLDAARDTDFPPSPPGPPYAAHAHAALQEVEAAVDNSRATARASPRLAAPAAALYPATTLAALRASATARALALLLWPLTPPILVEADHPPTLTKCDTAPLKRSAHPRTAFSPPAPGGGYPPLPVAFAPIFLSLFAQASVTQRALVGRPSASIAGVKSRFHSLLEGSRPPLPSFCLASACSGRVRCAVAHVLGVLERGDAQRDYAAATGQPALAASPGLHATSASASASPFAAPLQYTDEHSRVVNAEEWVAIHGRLATAALTATGDASLDGPSRVAACESAYEDRPAAVRFADACPAHDSPALCSGAASASELEAEALSSLALAPLLPRIPLAPFVTVEALAAEQYACDGWAATHSEGAVASALLRAVRAGMLAEAAETTEVGRGSSDSADRTPLSTMVYPHAFVRRLLSCCDHSGGGVCAACLRGVGTPLSALVERGWRVADARSANASAAPPASGSRTTRVDYFDIGAAVPIARCASAAEAGPMTGAEASTPCFSAETADETETPSSLPAPAQLTQPTTQLSAVSAASAFAARDPSSLSSPPPAPGPEAVSALSLPALQAFAEAMGPMALATLLLPLLLHRPTHSGLPDVWMVRGTLLRPLPRQPTASPAQSPSSSPVASPAVSRRPSPTKQSRPPTPATHNASSVSVSLASLLADDNTARRNTPLRHLLHPRQSADSSPAAAAEALLSSAETATPAAALDGPPADPTVLSASAPTAVTPMKPAFCLRPHATSPASAGPASAAAMTSPPHTCPAEPGQHKPSDSAPPQGGMLPAESARCLALPKRISFTAALARIARAGALTPRTQTCALDFLARVRQGAGEPTAESAAAASTTVSGNDTAIVGSAAVEGIGRGPDSHYAPVDAAAVESREDTSYARTSAVFAALLTEVLLPRWAVVSAHDEAEEVLVQLPRAMQDMDEPANGCSGDAGGVGLIAAMGEREDAEHEASDGEAEEDECSSFPLPLATLTASGTSQPWSCAVGVRATGTQNTPVFPTGRAMAATAALPLCGVATAPASCDIPTPTTALSLAPKKSVGGATASPAATTTSAPTPSKSASALALRLFARTKTSGANASVATPSASPAARALASAVECIDLDSDEDQHPVPAVRAHGGCDATNTRLFEASALVRDEDIACPQQPPPPPPSTTIATAIATVIATPRMGTAAGGRTWLNSGFTATPLRPDATGLEGSDSDSDLEVTEVVTVTPAKKTAPHTVGHPAPDGCEARTTQTPMPAVSQRAASATKSKKANKSSQSSSKRALGNAAAPQLVRSNAVSRGDTQATPCQDTTAATEHQRRAGNSSTKDHNAGVVVFSLTDSEDEEPMLRNRTISPPPPATSVRSAETQPRKRSRAVVSATQNIAAYLPGNLGSNAVTGTVNCATTPVDGSASAVDGDLSASDAVNKRPRPSRSRTARTPADSSAAVASSAGPRRSPRSAVDLTPAAVAVSPPAEAAVQLAPAMLATPVSTDSAPASPAVAASRCTCPLSPLPPPPAPPAPLSPATPPSPGPLPRPGHASLSLRWHANALLPLVAALCAHTDLTLSPLLTDGAGDVSIERHLASAFPTGLPLPQLLVSATTTLALRTALALATSVCNSSPPTPTPARAPFGPTQASASHVDLACVVASALWSVQQRAIAISQMRPDAPLFVPGLWGQRHRSHALLSQETQGGVCVECLARLVEARVHRMLRSDAQCADVPCTSSSPTHLAPLMRPACARALTLHPHASAYVLLSEVKGPRDSLSRAQECWLELLAPLLRCEVAWVLEPRAWAAQEARVKKMCSDGAAQETRDAEEQVGASENRPARKARQSRLKEEGGGARRRTTDPTKRSKRQKVEDDG